MKKRHSKGVYELFFKRFIDVTGSLLVLILFWWVYLIIALLVRINLGTPVIFEQDRPGKDGKIFKLYKFRSMSDARDSDGQLLPDSKRLNRFGKVLRSTSLDELPELFNILKGDMSIVGPRPLLVKFLPFYGEFEMRRHEVRPGLTGWAQVNGRNAISWKEKFSKDVEYVDNITFWMDVRVVLLTVKKIFVRDGIEFVEGHQSVLDYLKESKDNKGEGLL